MPATTELAPAFEYEMLDTGVLQHLPPQAFWGLEPRTNTPFVGLQMWKATERRAATEADNGGPVAENVGLQYTLTVAQKLYLGSLGVDADQLLAYMNARTNITADKAARC